MGTPDVLLCDRHDQPEIRFGQTLLGIQISLLYSLGELHLVLASQKGNPADFLQIHLHEIGRYLILAHIHQTRLNFGRLLFARTEFFPLFDRLDLQNLFRPDNSNTAVLQFLIQQFESFEILLDIRQDMNNFIFCHKTTLFPTKKQFLHGVFLCRRLHLLLG